MKNSKSGHEEAEKYRKLILAGLESGLDDPMSVEKSIGNPVEPVASIGSAEFNKARLNPKRWKGKRGLLIWKKLCNYLRLGGRSRWTSSSGLIEIGCSSNKLGREVIYKRRQSSRTYVHFKRSAAKRTA
jgi:hypothetical protein